MFDFRFARRKSRKRDLDDPKSTRKRYSKYAIGRGTYGSPEIIAWDDKSKLTIGAYCSIADGVKIFLGGEHRIDWVSTYPFSAFWDKAKHITGHPSSKGDINIGNDVWIATDAKILSGVNIGDGAVIGAGAVVSSNIPAYAIAVGNPAKIIRFRFDEDTISRLRNIAWWNWNQKEIEQALPFLLSSDIHRFIEWAEQHRTK